jgi:Glycosyltransferase
VGPFILYFGKLLRQKGVHLLLDAWRRLAPRHPHTSLVVVGFGSDRAWLESLAGERVIFTGAMDHAQLQQLVPCAELVVVPSVLPEAFGMVAAEAASCGLMTVVSDHSGLAEVAAGLGPASRTFDGSVDDLERAVGEVMDMPAADREAIGLLGRERVCARWSWERIADRLISVPLDFADLIGG